MSAIYDPHSFHSDGTPRRKYEIDEIEQKRLALSAVVGLIAFNIIVLVKNIFFSSSPPHSESGHADNAASRNGAVLDFMHDDESASLSGSDEPDETEEPLGDGKYGSFRSASYVGDGGGALASASYGGQSPLQFSPGANDNEVLYGTQPGTIVKGFDRNDGDSILGPGGNPVGIGNGIDRNDGDSNPGAGPGAGGNSNVPPDPETDDSDEEDDDEPTPTRANRAPVIGGPVVLAGLMANTSIVIAFADLLRNASDPDGDPITVVNLQASSGRLQVLSDGRGWVFTPDANDVSSVSFNYAVSDGSSNTAQTAELDLLVPDDKIILGTKGDDRIVGTMGDDVIDALCGNDIVIGRAGNDVIYGGCGNDRIFGEDGDDLIFAGGGDDFVSGGKGNDVVFGGTGRDVLSGDDGDDVLHGEDGDDVLVGGYGKDIVFGGEGNDRLEGEAGDDVLDGGAGDDSLDGGAGADTLIGAAGSDEIFGGEANDLIRASQGDGDDVIDGGAGIDTYDTTLTTAAMFVDLSAGTASSAETGNDTLASVEAVTTGAGADCVIGSDGNNTILTNAGNDTIDAGKGDDVVSAGAGNDVIVAAVDDGDDDYDGGDGIDVYDLSAIVDDVTIDIRAGLATGGSIGTDTLTKIENVISGAGDDTIAGDDCANEISGGAGSDIIDAGGGDDSIIATVGDDDDTYIGGAGSDVYDLSETSADAIVDLLAGISESAETGADTLFGIENVIGGSGNDILIANEERNIFTGGDGDDLFVFRSVATIGNGRGSRDKILDFSVGDRIDIRDISDEIYKELKDAFDDPVMRRFVMIGMNEFDKPGQMRLIYDDLGDETVTVLQGNIDDSPDVDFEIELSGRHLLHYEDFRN